MSWTLALHLGANRVWVGHKSISDTAVLYSCGPTTCVVSTRWMYCQHLYDTRHRGSCRILWGHQCQHQDQEPGIFHVDTQPFTFHTSIPRLELGDILLLGVFDEHEVISIEMLPPHTGREVTWKHLQHQDEEQCAKDRSLMHTNFQVKLFTVQTIGTHMTLAVGVPVMDNTQPIETKALQGQP